jgi:hypothetical protein
VTAVSVGVRLAVDDRHVAAARSRPRRERRTRASGATSPVREWLDAAERVAGIEARRRARQGRREPWARMHRRAGQRTSRGSYGSDSTVRALRPSVERPDGTRSIRTAVAREHLGHRRQAHRQARQSPPPPCVNRWKWRARSLVRAQCCALAAFTPHRSTAAATRARALACDSRAGAPCGRRGARSQPPGGAICRGVERHVSSTRAPAPGVELGLAGAAHDERPVRAPARSCYRLR